MNFASWIHSYFDNVMTKFMIRTDEWKTDVKLLRDIHEPLTNTLGSRLPVLSNLMLRYLPDFISIINSLILLV